jgi:hypothetical protein
MVDLPLRQSDIRSQAKPLASVCHWPGGKPFALFLSHDVDQIHDREIFRVLADVNHIRRRLTTGEPGNNRLACRRLARALLRPKPATKDFETLLAIEGRHGFRSTYFLLHDDYWARQGARYSFECPEIQAIARLVLAAKCELGVHGGYYRFNNAARYRESLEAVTTAFNVRPCGIRNHLLRFSYPETWRAQSEAGFGYDATYGLPDELGPRGGWPFPFQTCDAHTGKLLDLFELPLTVMDATLFRHLRLSGAAALEKAWETVHAVTRVGGLVSLLWHNNYFNEPEYADWQMVYEELLNRLAQLQPWCATGAEINAWWRARLAVQVQAQPAGANATHISIHSPQAISGLAVELRFDGKINLPPGAEKLAVRAGLSRIVLPPLRAGQTVVISVASQSHR